MALRTLFAAKEQRGDALLEIKALEIINTLHEQLASSSYIAVKTNLLNEFPYPFRTSVELLELVLKELRAVYQGEVYFIEPCFKGKSWDTLSPEEQSLLQRYNVHCVDGSKELVFIESKAAGTTFPGYYVPDRWVQAPLRVSFASPRIHRHHAVITYFGLVGSLVDIFFLMEEAPVQLKKNEFIKLISIDIDAILEDIGTIVEEKLPAYGINDSRMIGMTNEHSPFLRTKHGDTFHHGAIGKSLDTIFYNSLVL